MAPRISLCVDGATDVGTRRQDNEDAWWAGFPDGEHFFMLPGPAPLDLLSGTAPVLLVVSDGVGGSNAGEVASRTAILAISEELGRAAAGMVDADAADAAVMAAIHAADLAVKVRGSERGFEGMGATLSLLCIGAGTALWGQAGDSRIYVCRRGKLRQISRDHSPVGRMRQRGEITEAEARRHPSRNQIDQSLGNNEAEFQPEIGSEEVHPGDVFLVCSDGLSDGLWDSEIEVLLAAIRTPRDVRPAVQQMVAAAKKASGRDNITAVVALAWIRTGPDEAPAEKPSLWRRLFGKQRALASPPRRPQDPGRTNPAQ